MNSAEYCEPRGHVLERVPRRGLPAGRQGRRHGRFAAMGNADRLVVLTTMDGLLRVEQGRLLPRSWRVRVDSSLTEDSAFEAAMVIARVSGCEINVARRLMRQLPHILETPLYWHQAQRLVRELGKVASRATLIPNPGAEEEGASLPEHKR